MKKKFEFIYLISVLTVMVSIGTVIAVIVIGNMFNF